jgi:NAD(P)-dependent dehydrogenase (short-subunit alcohol dehydrogenase family)
MKGLDGKVAIVSGGATSIGAAIVRAFHAAGSSVVVADIDDVSGSALATALGRKIAYHRTDITDDAQIESCVAATAVAFGGIDFLINNACAMFDKGLRSSRQEWLAALNVNVVSGARFVAAVAPHMRRRGSGAIVNFSSIAGKQGQRGRALYPASKAAILQLTRNEAMELAVDQIRVNTVSPGWTWSTTIARLTNGDRAKADRIAAEYHPLGRVGDAEEVAQAVLFLCSDDARHITGIDLPVDGGYAMSGPDQGTPRMGRLAE